MITILSRDTAWSHRYIVYEKDGKRDVFTFPLNETFASAEARLNHSLETKAKVAKVLETTATPIKTRRTKAVTRATEDSLLDEDAKSNREDGGIA